MNIYSNSRRGATLISPLDRPITVTRFTRQSASSKKTLTLTLRELAEVIKEERAKYKGDLPWLKLALFGDIRTNKGSLRTNANMQAISGIELDYDDGDISPARARAILSDANVAAFIFTTPSHMQPGKGYRWRILCPTSRDLDPIERERLVARIHGLFGGRFDPASFTMSQSFYYGNVEGGTPVQTYLVDGRYIDHADDLDEGALGSDGKPYRESREERESANDNNRDGEPMPLEQFRSLLDDIADNRQHIDSETGKHHFIDGRAGWTAVLKAATNEYKDHPQRLKKAKRIVREFSEQSFSWQDYDDGKPNAENAPHVFNDQWNNFLSRAKRGQYNPVTMGTLVRAASDDWKSEHREQGLLDWLDDPEDEIRKQVSGLEWFGDIEPALSSTYLIKGLFDVGSFSVVWGNSKAGKTFGVLDVMHHLAAGLPWRGLRTRKAAVLYLALEGGNRIKNRLVALQREHGSEPIPFALRRGGADLLKKDGDVKAIIRMVSEVQDEYPDLPVVVVVDTLSRALAGGDESSSVDMTAFVRNVDTIREKTGAHVMVVHHAGKDVSRGMRGHSSLMAAIDTELFVEHDEGTGIRTMRIGVQRDEDTTGQEFRYRLRSVEVGIDQDGDPVRSAVCDPVTDNELCGGDDPAPISGHPAKAFEILQDIASDRSTVPLEEWRNASSASDWLTSIEKGDTKRKTFRRAKEELEKRGWIEMTAKGVRLTDPSRTKFSAADFDDDEPPRGNRRNRNHREDLS